MTEYIDIQPEPTDDPAVMRLVTNLALSEVREVYDIREQGEEGSALAQALFAVPGLAALTIDARDLLIRRAPDVEWHDLVEDISDALRDFFL